MIPPLVALLASADDPSNRDTVAKLLGGVGSQVEPLQPVPSLAPLPIRRLVPDGPGLPEIGQLLRTLKVDQLIPGLRSPEHGAMVQAGLYLIHDFVEQAHQLSQESESHEKNDSAPYWHAIVHRREPDYGNSRYWFRRVGHHPVYEPLAREVSTLLADDQFAAKLRFDRLLDRRGRWDAMAFVDLCQECGTDWDDRAKAAAQVQAVEMRHLLEFSCHQAVIA